MSHAIGNPHVVNADDGLDATGLGAADDAQRARSRLDEPLRAQSSGHVDAARGALAAASLSEEGGAVLERTDVAALGSRHAVRAFDPSTNDANGAPNLGSMPDRGGTVTARVFKSFGEAALPTWPPTPPMPDDGRIQNLPETRTSIQTQADALPAAWADVDIGKLTTEAARLQLAATNEATAQAGDMLKYNAAQMKVQNAKILDQVKTWAANAEKAHAQSTGVGSWFGKILGAVAAVAGAVVAVIATVATAGAAAPLIALAVIGCVGAFANVANQISAAAGGPDLSVSALATRAGIAICKDFGMDEEKAKKVGQVVGNAIALPLAIIDPSIMGNLAGGIARLAGRSESQVAIITATVSLVATALVMVGTMAAGSGLSRAGAAAAEVSQLVSMLRTGASVTQKVAGGASQIVGAEARIEGAVYQYRTITAQSGMKHAEAGRVPLKLDFEETAAQLDALYKAAAKIAQGVSDALRSMSGAQMQVSANMAGVARNA